MEEGLVMAFIAFALGGVLKGAIGAGTPVIAVPIMSLYYGVPFAVAVFALPAFLSNLWQVWRFRSDLLPRRFIVLLAAGAGIGAAVGTFMLAALSSDLLMAGVAAVTLAYVVFRIARPDRTLSYGIAKRWVFPVAAISGVLQGAAGISAPVSLTFISAMRLSRPAFIATISAFFLAMSVVQIPTLWSVGLLTTERFAISAVACLPLFAAMGFGGWLARFIRRDTFERIVLALLTAIALKLLWEAI